MLRKGPIPGAERTELQKKNDLKRLMDGLDFENYEYPFLKEELKKHNSQLTIKCKRHNHIFKQSREYHIHNRKYCCPLGEKEEQFINLINNLNKSFPDGRYTIKFEDYCNPIRDGKSYYDFKFKGYCNIHNIEFWTRTCAIKKGNCSCPECIKELVHDSSKFHKIKRTKELKEQMTLLVNSGMDDTEISKELGCNRTMASKIRNEFKLSRGLDKKIENRLEKIRKLSVEGKTLPEISKILNIPTHVLRGNCINHDIPINFVGHSYEYNKDWKLVYTKEELLEKLYSGTSGSEIAEEIGINETSLYQYFREIGIFYNEVNTERRRLRSLEIKDLVDKGYIMKDICFFLRTSRKIINNVAQEFGIELVKGNRSEGELQVEKYLKDNNISFKEQSFQTEIEGRSTNRIYIDYVIEINDISIFIEVNGIQHYKYNSFFHRNNYINFQLQVQRDHNIREYCRNNGILFIEIPSFHLSTYLEIKEFLDKVIKEGINPGELINIESYYERPINEILNEKLDII